MSYERLSGLNQHELEMPKKTNFYGTLRHSANSQSIGLFGPFFDEAEMFYGETAAFEFKRELKNTLDYKWLQSHVNQVVHLLTLYIDTSGPQVAFVFRVKQNIKGYAKPEVFMNIK